MSQATNNQRIFELLCAEAAEHGENCVNVAIRRFRNRKARAIQAGAKVEKRRTIPKAWTRQALLRQDGKCARCGRELPVTHATGDHIHPISTGGIHASTNIAALCRSCNSAKGNRDVYEDAKRTNQSLLERELLKGRDNG